MKVARLRAGVVVALCCAACEARAGLDAPHVDSASSVAETVRGPVVAVTIDDLPWVGAVRTGETNADALRRMVTAFTSRNVPALGFVNCERVQSGAPLLPMWLEAGLELGNHSAAHRDLNDAPLEDWLHDVRSCHEYVRELSGQNVVYFRYPFLHQGATVERQQAALQLLRELPSPIAHVTIDNSDWILAAAYGDAVRARDAARAAAIARAFVVHILSATEHYRSVAQRKLGRPVPHVLLLHANLLVAENVGMLLDSLTARGFRFISVAAAQRDSAYALTDAYTGPDGLSWLYRIQPATPELSAWDDAESERLRSRWRQSQ